ncbi:hypothetical protein CEXT_406731 [Caerostris extrusa]|uniref:Uncharacterized protein n=1 Tax=Caerostris extrusa TaxID=172846 RepID=A0AAV4XYE5_CAEEX|nr:hypothetical protein CEXT_406731 [Caerostris extrusa]
MQQAIDCGLIKSDNVAVVDSSSEMLKSLELALIDGTVDVESGKLKDSKETYDLNLEQAFEQQLILITEDSLLHNLSNINLKIINSSLKFACTMEEALNNVLIDPKTFS